MKVDTIIREWRRIRARVPELGERHMICDWDMPEDGGPMVDEYRFGQLLAMLPDKVATNLEKARLAQDGRIPMLKAGLGYEECLGAIIVDGTPVANSSTEAYLSPPNLLPANYMQPGGIPGRTIVCRARGRVTTLTTAATLIYNWGANATSAATLPTTWCISGGITQDTVIQTNTMWRVDTGATTRSVGASGTVFAMGDASIATAAVTIANQTASFMGSAGSATPAAVTVNLTVPQWLGLTAKWSLTTAYSITAHRYVLEALN